jgi:steroid 5-alpha reductase family enzyme
VVDLHALFWAAVAAVTLATLVWLISLWKRDVSIVDSIWSIMMLLATVVYISTTSELGPRGLLLLLLVFAWAVRLSAYITWRNWGTGEDQRYTVIRKNNEPFFELKSYFIIFLFQAALAMVVVLPVLAGVSGSSPVTGLDYLGAGIVLAGILFESIADQQMARFKSAKENNGQVMDGGLWRYSRHPNYFGEFCIWWGFYIISVSAGAWWTVVSPLIMTFLLLKFSGVALLEKTISERRPAYREYVQRTSTFFPWFPRSNSATSKQEEIVR